MRYITSIILLFSLFTVSFAQSENPIFNVNIHLSSNPYNLNIITSTSAVSVEIQEYIFEPLMKKNKSNNLYEPYLVLEKPTVEKISFKIDNLDVEGLKFTYEINPKAKFNDGSTITAKDIEFCIKTILNPFVDNESSRPYYSAIYDFEFDKKNKRKFSIICKDRYFLNEDILNGLYAIQKEKYDPKNLMDNLSVRDLSNEKAYEKNIIDPELIKFAEKFAEEFNSENYSKDNILGSGPYFLDSWTEENLVLLKNPSWWAKKQVNLATNFIKAPDKLVFWSIWDNDKAFQMLKDQKMDVMKLNTKQYELFKEDSTLKNLYYWLQYENPSYYYIGLNTKNDKLSEKKVRQALCYATDYDTISTKVNGGLTKRVIGPISPLNDFFNPDIIPYVFDLEKAKKLLDDANWKDSNGNGIRDKLINDRLIELKLEVLITNGSQTSPKIFKIIKEDYEKIGVELNIKGSEWTVFLDKIKSHDFEMNFMGWVTNNGLSDMKQLWHTDSYNGGSNYVGYGNAKSDEIIDKIRFELNKEKRDSLYYLIQEDIYESASYIFLYQPIRILAVSKKNEKPILYNQRNPYNLFSFKRQKTN